MPANRRELCGLANGSAVFDAISSTTVSAERRGELVVKASVLAGSWSDITRSQQHHIVSTLITRVEVEEDCVVLHVVLDRLSAILSDNPDRLECAASQNECSTEPVIFSIPTRPPRVGRAAQFILNADDGGNAKRNAPLFRLLVRAHHLQQQL